ncbi:MAG: hypothetical protein CMN00_03765 [Rickettsiales bacterium]|nr:hypothetical protein [Rickettsiales bacterium]|tara:strand:- start:180 stop:683 length:504 start_codon:yes stop_codon:yes gene_type:complete
MKLFNRLIFIFLFVFLNGCGFQPLYLDMKKVLNYKINIIVKTKEPAPSDIQIMKNLLSERLHTPNAKPSELRLILAMTKSKFGLGLQKDLTTTKYGVRYNIDFAFYDAKGLVSKGTVEKQSSFDFGESAYANLVAEETANKNVLKLLANEIATLTLTLRSFSRKIYP